MTLGQPRHRRLHQTAEALAERMPPDGWQAQVTWTTGQQTPARLEATDTGRGFRIGEGGPARQARGAEAELLAWLLGRSTGTSLAGDGCGPLPDVPSVYLT